MSDKSREAKRKRLLWLRAALVLLLCLWFGFNRPAYFGFHAFAFTVYSGVPLPGVDLKVLSGQWIPSLRAKSHTIRLQEVKDLLSGQPQVLTIGTGWHGVAVPEKAILKLKGIKVEVLKTPDAIRRFNSLRKRGIKVAALIHSTC